MEAVAKAGALKLVDSSELAVLDNDQQVVSLVGEDFDERTATQVIRYAIEVHQFDLSIRTSARNLCVSLYRCRSSYIEGSKNKSSSGWGSFCEKNFSSIGMSDGNIRAAVRTGEALVRHEEKHPEGIELFSRLSRAALFALGGNEDTLVTVQEVLAANPEANVTAADVRRLNEQLQEKTIALLETEKRMSAIEDTNVSLTQKLDERRTQVSDWRERAELAEQRAKTPVEAVVYKLPEGVKNEDELRHNLQRENASLKTEADRLRSAVDRESIKLTEVQRTLGTAEQIKHVLVDLESEIQLLRAKFTRAMVERMTSGTPAVKERLKSIAAEFRAMASAIDVD